FLLEHVDLFPGLADLVYQLQGLFQLRFDLFVGEFFIGELNDVLDDAGVFFKLFADGYDFTNNYRGTRQRLQHDQLTALDALCDFNFTVAGQQRNRAHLAEVHADGIIRLFERTWGEVEFDVGFRLFGPLVGLRLTRD